MNVSIAEISAELGDQHGLGHMDPNAVAKALWEWAETTPRTPHNGVVWDEVDLLLSEGYSAPNCHERRYAALAAILALGGNA
jgi:hypothetical protein